MRITWTLAAAALTALALTACGTASGSSTPVQGATAPASSAAPSANVGACQDYAKQRTWITAHKATLTLVDIATFGGWLQMDVADSTGQLHTDFASESAGYQRILNSGTPTHRQSTAYKRVRADCSAIGVIFK